jgi:hypothetical protein
VTLLAEPSRAKCRDTNAAPASSACCLSRHAGVLTRVAQTLPPDETEASRPTLIALPLSFRTGNLLPVESAAQQFCFAPPADECRSARSRSRTAGPRPEQAGGGPALERSHRGESERGDRDAVSPRVAFYAGRTRALLLANWRSLAVSPRETSFAAGTRKIGRASGGGCPTAPSDAPRDAGGGSVTPTHARSLRPPVVGQ